MASALDVSAVTADVTADAGVGGDTVPFEALGPWLERIAEAEEAVNSARERVSDTERSIAAVEAALAAEAAQRAPLVRELEGLRAEHAQLQADAAARREKAQAKVRQTQQMRSDIVGLERSVQSTKDTRERGSAEVASAEGKVRAAKFTVDRAHDRTKELQDLVEASGEDQDPIIAQLAAERQKKAELSAAMRGKLIRLHEQKRAHREAAAAVAERHSGMRAQVNAEMEIARASRAASEAVRVELEEAESAAQLKQREKDLFRASLREVRRVNEKLRADLAVSARVVQDAERVRDEATRSRCAKHLAALDGRLAVRAQCAAAEVGPGSLLK